MRCSVAGDVPASGGGSLLPRRQGRRRAPAGTYAAPPPSAAQHQGEPGAASRIAANPRLSSSSNRRQSLRRSSDRLPVRTNERRVRSVEQLQHSHATILRTSSWCPTTLPPRRHYHRSTPGHVASLGGRETPAMAHRESSLQLGQPCGEFEDNLVQANTAMGSSECKVGLQISFPLPVVYRDTLFDGQHANDQRDYPVKRPTLFIV